MSPRSSAASTRRCRWRWCRCSTRKSASTWACGRPAPASRATAPIRITRSASRRSTRWSTSGCSKFAHQKFGAKKAGLMLINNPWGQGEREGPAGSEQGRSVGRDRRRREVREQRRRHRAAARAAQGCRRRRPDPGRQCRARRAGDEIARAHGLEGAGDFALGHFRRPLPRACRPDRRRAGFRADLQLLRQAERRSASGSWRR